MDNTSSFEFRSWIPTVTGKLSFTIIGKTSWPRPCVHLNLIENQHRGIFLQERFCHDFLSPFVGLSDRQKDWLFGWTLSGRKKPLIGRHFFWCTVDKGLVDEQGKLASFSGTVFIVPATKNGVQAYKKLRKRILAAKKQPRKISDHIDNAKTNFREESLIECSFSLSRSGEFQINGIETRSVKGFGKIENKEIIDRYCALAFSFLRDITHNHQHHDGENDLIVRLHEYDPEKPNEWKDQVYFDLFRRVIAFKRIRSPFHITNATGILAYVRAFKELFDPPSGRESFCEEATIQSLETAQYELQLRHSLNNNRLSFVQTMVFGLMTLIVSMAGFATFLPESDRSAIAPNDWITAAIKFGAEFPFRAFASTVVLAFMVYSFFGFTNPERKGYYKDALRVLFAIPKWISVPILIGLGVFCLWATFLLLF